MEDETISKYRGLNEILRLSNEELLIIEEELGQVLEHSYNTEVVRFLTRRKEELVKKIKECIELLRIITLSEEELDGKDRIMYLLMCAEEEFYSIDKKIDDILETSDGLDNEELQTLISRRDKLSLKIYYCRDLLNLNIPEKEKTFQK